MEPESKWHKQQKIGQGAYGQVWKAYNHQTNRIVALKICKFQDTEEGVPSTCLRQVSILKSLDHPNLVKLLSAQFIKGTPPRLQMQFQYVDYDLNKYIKTCHQQNKRGLSVEQSKKMIKSIIQATFYLHSKGIIHRDLKPQNILVTNEGEIKIADFGLGRIIPQPLETMSKQIQTLWYRAPELLLGTTKYTWAVDTWSIGCIFVEMVQGKPLFGGDCEIGQLFEIFYMFGSPKLSQWPQLHNMPQFKLSLPKFISHPPKFHKLTSKEGLSFLGKLLQINPSKRMQMGDALKDQYLKYC